MSYKTSERDSAILDIASGHPDLKDIALYKDLPSFNWINITWSGGIMQGVALRIRADSLIKSC